MACILFRVQSMPKERKCDWKNGDVKEIPDGVNLIGFEKVTEQKPETTFKKRKWTRKEKLSDKMERKNFYFEESEDCDSRYSPPPVPISRKFLADFK